MINKSEIQVEVIGYTNGLLNTCAEAAAVCYNSKPHLGIVEHCVNSGHGSILEHCSFTFKVSGISRACANQLVRHRIASYSQQSQRYVDMSNATFTIPSEIAHNEEAMAIYSENLEATMECYNKLQKLGIKNEDARFVLPNACSTEIYITMNVRGLMNFFNERLCTNSQWEIRQLARKMRSVILSISELNERSREIFKHIFVPKCLSRGVHFCSESKPCGIVPCEDWVNDLIDYAEENEE